MFPVIFLLIFGHIDRSQWPGVAFFFVQPLPMCTAIMMYDAVLYDPDTPRQHRLSEGLIGPEGEDLVAESFNPGHDSFCNKNIQVSIRITTRCLTNACCADSYFFVAVLFAYFWWTQFVRNAIGLQVSYLVSSWWMLAYPQSHGSSGQSAHKRTQFRLKKLRARSWRGSCGRVCCALGSLARGSLFSCPKRASRALRLFQCGCTPPHYAMAYVAMYNEGYVVAEKHSWGLVNQRQEPQIRVSGGRGGRGRCCKVAPTFVEDPTSSDAKFLGGAITRLLHQNAEELDRYFLFLHCAGAVLGVASALIFPGFAYKEAEPRWLDSGLAAAVIGWSNTALLMAVEEASVYAVIACLVEEPAFLRFVDTDLYDRFRDRPPGGTESHEVKLKFSDELGRGVQVLHLLVEAAPGLCEVELAEVHNITR